MEEKNKDKARGFFGRRIGRPLSNGRKMLVNDMLKRLSLNTPLPNAEQTWMEIGFGDGEHLAALMERYPDYAFIGIEPYINGMGNFLNRIKDKPHNHVRVQMDDAIPILDTIKDNSIDRLYVLNPDPWPKTRHHKRRIINQDNLDRFARILKPGAWLVMATDVADLAEWMVTEASNHPAFTWTAECADDWNIQPDWWAVTTRYARKGLAAGRQEYYLVFKK